MSQFKARLADCHFNESVFPTLGGENKQLEKEISWNELSLSHLDPRNKQCELEVQKIIHLQSLANRLPDAFTDPNRIGFWSGTKYFQSKLMSQKENIKLLVSLQHA